MNNILEVLLIVFLIFAPVFLMLEAILFIRPKECWVGVTNIFINSWVFLQEKWRYFFMSRLEKINHVSTQINQTSDLAEQKNLLAQLKHLANKYRKEREGELHPKKSRLEVGNWSYQPWVRFSLLVLTSFVFYGLVFVLFWLFGKNPIDTLKAWLAMDQDPRGFATVVVAVFAAVPALLLWFYRDLNSYREREGSHRDVMFQEHKQLVEWATTETKPDTKDSAETETETKQITSSVPMIQVAGIYQLAPFLKDHHANLYQRSTLETLRAIVNSGRPKWDKWVVQFEWWVGKGMKGRMPEKPALTAAEKAVHAVLRENSILFYHQYFNAMDFNLAGFDASDLVFIGCDLEGAQLEGGNFQCVDFYGSNMRDASLQGANMSEVGLQCVNLNGADLLGADLTDAVLIGADMYHVNLMGVELAGANFNGVHLYGANLLGVNFSSFNLQEINLIGAVVEEPKLSLFEAVFKLKNSLFDVIRLGAFSIADEKVTLLPTYDRRLAGYHLKFSDALDGKGLTPTTKASLKAEEAQHV